MDKNIVKKGSCSKKNLKLNKKYLTKTIISRDIDKVNSETTINQKICQVSEKIFTTENGLTNIKKKFASNHEFNNYLYKKIEQYRKVQMLNDGKSSIAKIATSIDILDIIVNNFELRYKTISNDGKIEKYFFVKNYDSEIGIWEPINLEHIVTNLPDGYNVSDVRKTVNDVDLSLKNFNKSKENIKPLILPKSYIVLAKNVIYNLKTMESSNQIDTFGQFDFINSLDYQILPLNKVNPIKLEIVKRIFNDWSQGDKDIEIYLKQLVIAALDGNGRGVFNVIIGSGGNGKSSFLNILEELASKKYTVKLNLQDYLNDNKIGLIDQTTKLLVGHDLATGAKLSSALNSRFKELITNEAFMVDVKYKNAKFVQSRSLKIQSTNTLLDIFENTDAMRRRIRLLQWTNQNFSKLNNESTFNLDELIGTAINTKPDKEFYEAIIAYCLDEMDYFDKFIEIESVTEMTDEMVNDSDVVYGFLSYISDFGLDEMHMLPINILYELYKIWHHQENPGGSPLKQKSFTTRLRTNCVKFGFKFSTDRVRLTSLSTLEYSQNIINYLILDKPLNINTKQKVYYLYNNENKIPKSEVDLFKKQLIEINSIDTVSTRELIILDYLRLNGNTKAASLFD